MSFGHCCARFAVVDEEGAASDEDSCMSGKPSNEPTTLDLSVHLNFTFPDTPSAGDTSDSTPVKRTSRKQTSVPTEKGNSGE